MAQLERVWAASLWLTPTRLIPFTWGQHGQDNQYSQDGQEYDGPDVMMKNPLGHRMVTFEYGDNEIK